MLPARHEIKLVCVFALGFISQNFTLCTVKNTETTSFEVHNDQERKYFKLILEIIFLLHKWLLAGSG